MMHTYVQTPAGLYDRNLGAGSLYSHVVVARAGDTIYVSGQLPRNADGEVVGEGDMSAQIEQVVKNLNVALAAVNATLDDVVATTTYTTKIDEYFAHVGTRLEMFNSERMPTSTTVGVDRLSDPRFMVEINAMAVVDR